MTFFYWMAAMDGQVPAANACRLFYQCHVGKTATIKFSGGSESGNACANDAYFMGGISCLCYAVFLLN